MCIGTVTSDLMMLPAWPAVTLHLCYASPSLSGQLYRLMESSCLGDSGAVAHRPRVELSFCGDIVIVRIYICAIWPMLFGERAVPGCE